MISGQTSHEKTGRYEASLGPLLLLLLATAVGTTATTTTSICSYNDRTSIDQFNFSTQKWSY